MREQSGRKKRERNKQRLFFLQYEKRPVLKHIFRAGLCYRRIIA